MPQFPPVIFAIAFAAVVVALTAFGRRLPVPPPVLQVVAGLLVGLVPTVSVPELEPDVVFFVFLPPVLWAAAFFTSLREFKANLRPISLLAVGLVLATSGVVAVVAHELLPGMPWSVAIALGAIVSPPDAVAATAIVSRLPVPRRVIVLLEGESLVNDASALVLYRTAVAAAVTGVFSLGESIVRFFIDAGVGTAIGLLVGWLIIQAARRTRDTMADTLLTVAGPYVAWIAAESLHVSAVLACVAGGLYTRQHLSTAVAPVLTPVFARSLGPHRVRAQRDDLPPARPAIRRPAQDDAGVHAGAHGVARRAGGICGDRRAPALGSRCDGAAAVAQRGPAPPGSAAVMETDFSRVVDQHARHRLPGHGTRTPAAGR